MKALLGSALLALALGFSGPASQAESMSCTAKNGTKVVEFYLTVSGSAECFTGNDSNTINNGAKPFGVEPWDFRHKTGEAVTNQQVYFDNFTSGSPPAGAPSNITIGGTWSIAGSAFDKMMITLKESTTFATFLIDSKVPQSGVWGTNYTISHASIYTNGNVLGAVPLPAAGWLLLGVVGALGAAKRRRKNLAMA